MRVFVTRLLQPSPLKAGLAVAVLLFVLHPHTPLLSPPPVVAEFLRSVDNRGRNAMFRARGADPRPKGELPAVIVDLDEKALREVGQWPWSRDVVGALLQQIHACEPKVIGLDIVFAEPDRTSLKHQLPLLSTILGRPVDLPDSTADLYPDEALEYLQALVGPEPPIPADRAILMDNDAVMGEIVETIPNLVVGFFFQVPDDGQRVPGEDVPYGWVGAEAIVRAPGAMEESPFDVFAQIPYRPILNVVQIEDAARSAGCLTTAYDEAGTVRFVPLVWEYMPAPVPNPFGEGFLEKSGPNIYPALALEMVRLATGREGTVVIDELGVNHVQLGKTRIPTDMAGRFYVNFLGPEKTFDYVSAADVLHRRETVADRLRGKYVLIGTSAHGLRDIRTTPFSESAPGVEIHANVIDNILQNDFIQEPWYARGLSAWLLVLVGVVRAVLLAYARPLTGALASAGCIVGLVFLGYHLMFSEGLIINIVYPILAAALVFMTVMLFNYFFEGRQKRFIKNAFGTYLSPALVDQLVDQPEKLSLAGEEKELTVLFSDIRGFTSISEKLTAEGLASFLNEYLTPMSDIVMETRGYVDKFIGDAVMAFWGAPLDDPGHAKNAARASLKMMQSLHALQPQWDARGLPAIDIGIGLNTGLMSVGNMGSESRFNYTVMGDNVNLGSRLEGLNKPYGTNIIVSETTRAALGDGFHCRLLDKVRVKGKLEPVRIYELVAEGAPSDAVREEVEGFEDAFQAYQEQRWDDAERTLRALQDAHGKKVHAVYLERIAEFRKAPPGDDWDGVYTFTTK